MPALGWWGPCGGGGCQDAHSSRQGRPLLTMAPCILPPEFSPAAAALKSVEAAFTANNSQTSCGPPGAQFHAGVWTALPWTIPSLPESHRLPKGCLSALFPFFGLKGLRGIFNFLKIQFMFQMGHLYLLSKQKLKKQHKTEKPQKQKPMNCSKILLSHTLSKKKKKTNKTKQNTYSYRHEIKAEWRSPTGSSSCVIWPPGSASGRRGTVSVSSVVTRSWASGKTQKGLKLWFALLLFSSQLLLFLLHF